MRSIDAGPTSAVPIRTRRRRLLLLGAVVAGGLAQSPSASAHDAAAAPGDPQVSVAVGPAQAESVAGGLCYRDPIPVTQPRSFILTRTGSTTRALTVSWEMDTTWTDVIAPDQGTARFEPGSAQVVVPRREPQDPMVVDAIWSIRILDGPDYDVATGAASFEGLAPARPAQPGESCGYDEDREEAVRLRVGEPMPVLVTHGHRRYTLVEGSFPPGIAIDGGYVGGTPTEGGRWTAVVETCPGVAPERAICGHTTYRFTIEPVPTERTSSVHTDGPAATPEASTTSSTRRPATVAVAEEDDGSSGLGPAVAVGTGSVLAAAGAALGLRWRRAAAATPSLDEITVDGPGQDR